MKKTAIMVIIAMIITAAITYSITRRPLPVNTAVETHAEADSHANEPEGAHSDEESTAPKIDVKTEFALAGDSWDTIAATGKVGPNVNKVVKVSPRISGKVVRIYSNIGDMVRGGQTIATISSIELAEARALYRQAAAKVKAAESAYNQQVQLAKLGAFSKRPVEEASAQYSSSQGDLSEAKGELAQNKSELVRAESELAQCIARLDRAKELYKDQIVSRHDLETAEAEFRRDSADVETIKAKIKQDEDMIRHAEAQVEISKTYLTREEKVQNSNLLTSRELQSAKSELTMARIELRAASDNIKVLGASPSGSGEMISITSPISGKIIERAINIGEMADPSSILFTVMNLSDVWIEANVYEKDLSRIKKGQVAQIKVNTYPDRVFSGKITHISDTLDSESGTARIRCAVSNPMGLLKPAMFATVNIITAKRRGAVLIAKAAILDEAGKKIIFIPCMDCEEDVKAKKSICGAYDKREVKTGSVHGDRIEVLSGINPGEEVVTTGAFQLKTAYGSGTLEAGCSDH
ncbi:MAG: efflux RND transporter periplasmic adaptor subunit [Armatimonadota bacterium]